MEVDMVADMEVDKVAKDMVADMVATTVFEWGYAQSRWVAVAAMHITLSNTQLQLIFRQKAICWYLTTNPAVSVKWVMSNHWLADDANPR